MRKSGILVRSVGVMVMTIALMGAIGCGKKKGDTSNTPDAANADQNFSGDSDSGSAGGLQTVNFPYDAYRLTPEAKQNLARNAEILKDRPRLNVQIEGHCDERGSIQYNIALGEKRAKATKKYLVDQGVNADRLTTISFGEERPIATGSNEEAWARNRRANFVITSN